jgi:hypothetical protein
MTAPPFGHSNRVDETGNFSVKMTEIESQCPITARSVLEPNVRGGNALQPIAPFLQ